MDERENRNSGWRRLRIFVGLVAMAFAVTLAVVVGNRLSDEVLAVLAGAVCGVGAAIPTSLLIVAVSRRREDESTKARVQPSMPQGVYPPVVVVTPPGGQQRPSDWNYLPPSLAAPMQRHFTVVGGSSVDTEVMDRERYP
nr:hypothetical protein [Anaerolineae bacterium]